MIAPGEDYQYGAKKVIYDSIEIIENEYKNVLVGCENEVISGSASAAIISGIGVITALLAPLVLISNWNDFDCEFRLILCSLVLIGVFWCKKGDSISKDENKKTAFLSSIEREKKRY